ncbi:EamA family transporter [Colidextribacter sp. 210702-DFI.3.9]|nr:EamA family transporter [Colidextribacter sp. 210702-DFI.3.9]
MWLMFAVGSALFAGLTSVLAKCGIRKTDSTVATAIRTIVVLLFSWTMVFLVGSQDRLGSIGGKNLLFLILSGLATGGSWLCYFRALQLGDINKVVPIDKSSTVLTILLSALLLGENMGLTRGLGVVLIAAGTLLMIEKKSGETGKTGGTAWLWYAVGSAVFASLTAILGKVGISGVESNLGTAIRTGVVLVMSWVMVFVAGKQPALKAIPKHELGFICLSGLATGGSWLCYYRALQDGPAILVVPIDKLSILVTVLFSYVVFHEKLSRRSALGLVLLVGGTLVMLV